MHDPIDSRLERSRAHWNGAAPGWVRWEDAVAEWMEAPTEAMMDVGGVAAGVRVLDLACGAGSQTLLAAERVGPRGRVVANDISEIMLAHVERKAREAGLENVVGIAGAAETLDVEPNQFDVVISRLGLMLFHDPASALRASLRALRPGGRAAAMVLGAPDANAFMARPMEILLRHAGKSAPPPGSPGIFALGRRGQLAGLLADAGFVHVEERVMTPVLRMPSAEHAVAMMQEAFGAFRLVVSDQPEDVREAAWAEVAGALRAFESDDGFTAPSEVFVVAGEKPPTWSADSASARAS